MRHEGNPQRTSPCNETIGIVTTQRPLLQGMGPQTKQT